jgi:aerobic carbon-monoxide dehydrogenase medium subunit
MEFVAPETKIEALRHIASYRKDAIVVAGGTYALREIHSGFRKPTVVVHLGRVRELSQVEEGDRLSIGSTVTHRTIVRSTDFRQYPALAAASSTCGGWQTQNVGTIGGNLCNASPAADLMTPLLVHGARLTLESAERGKRIVPLDAFVLGPQHTARKDDELLTSVDVDPMGEGTVDGFVKVRRRSSMDSPILSVAVRFAVRRIHGPLEDVRIAVSGVAPSPYRVREAETLLAGRPLTDAAISAASEIIVKLASPISDARGSAEYRLAVLPRVLAKALKEAKAASDRGHKIS